MASGFIVLRDGRCLSVKSAVHDAVVRSIMHALPAANPLREWLVTQVPSEHDAELGYAFVRSADGVHVSREMDTRGFTAEIRQQFEGAARRAQPIDGMGAARDEVASALTRLRLMLDASDRKEPPLDLSDWRIEPPPCDHRIGPGWCPFAGFPSGEAGHGSKNVSK